MCAWELTACLCVYIYAVSLLCAVVDVPSGRGRDMSAAPEGVALDAEDGGVDDPATTHTMTTVEDDGAGWCVYVVSV